MGYTNPIGKGLVVGRIDEGVDFTGSGPLYAMSSGTIKSVQDSGWPGGVYILLHMDDGKDVYYAENIAPSVSVGEHVNAGQQIGTARGSSPFIEVGWGTDTPGIPVAHSHYTEGQVTTEGKDFAALLGTFGIHVPGAASSSTMGGSGSSSSSGGGGSPFNLANLAPSLLNSVIGPIEKPISDILERGALIVFGGLLIIFGIWRMSNGGNKKLNLQMPNGGAASEVEAAAPEMEEAAVLA